MMVCILLLILPLLFGTLPSECLKCFNIGILYDATSQSSQSHSTSVSCNNHCYVGVQALQASQLKEKLHNMSYTKGDFSILIDYSTSHKEVKHLSSILDIPLLTFKPLQCTERGCINQASLAPSATSLALLTKHIILKNKWQKASVIYDNTKASEAMSLSRQLDQVVRLTMHAMAHTPKGLLDTTSLKAFDSFKDSTIDVLIVVYPESRIQYLFNAITNQVPELRLVPLKFLIFLPIQKSTLTTSKLHTVLAVKFKRRSPVNSIDLSSLPSFGKNFLQMSVSEALLQDGATLSFMAACNVIKTNLNSINNLDNVITMENLRRTTFVGVTGPVQLSTDYTRVNTSLEVFSLRENKFVLIGQASETGIIHLTKEIQTNWINVDPFQDLNRPLKIVTKVEEPFVFKAGSLAGSDRYHGFLIDILNELSALLQFQYTIYEISDGQHGSKTAAGTWTGLIGEVLYKRADIALAPVFVSSDRQQVVQFTHPFMELDVGYVRKRPVLQSNLFLFLEPFTTFVWSITLLVILAFALSLFFIQYLSQKYEDDKCDDCMATKLEAIQEFFEMLWYAIGCTLQQGGEQGSPTSLSGRILTGCFWFCVLITISTYTANLAAYFTFEKSKLEQRTLDELLKEDSYFSLLSNSPTEEYVKHSKHRTYKLLYERVSSFQKFVNSVQRGIEKVRKEGNLVFIEDSSSISWIADRKPCDLKGVSGLFKAGFYGFPVAKNSPIAKPISDGISKLTDTGFIQSRRNNYWVTKSECNKTVAETKEKSSGSVQPEQLFGVFIILIAGSVAAILTLCGEVWCKHRSRILEKKRFVPRKTMEEPLPVEMKAKSSLADITDSKS